MQTVFVYREDHPDKKVWINKCDLKPSDILWSDKMDEQPEKVDKPKQQNHNVRHQHNHRNRS
jgi:hypothetical protein